MWATQSALQELSRGRQKNKKLLNAIKCGNFQVLDCMAYESDTMTDVTGKGTVKIYTEQGQYCGENFIMDFESAKEWPKRRNMRFWLLRCVCGQKKPAVYFRLFSEREYR